MPRKTRIDSASEVVRIMSKATMKIVPPAHVPLSPEDMPFFESVIAEFAKSELTDHQIELVALLARTMADLEREQLALRKGDSSKKQLVQMHVNSILGLRRSLSLHGRAKGGEARTVAQRRQMVKEIEANTPFGDDLISRPN
jgi:hypothetical protein